MSIIYNITRLKVNMFENELTIFAGDFLLKANNKPISDAAQLRSLLGVKAGIILLELIPMRPHEQSPSGGSSRVHRARHFFTKVSLIQGVRRNSLIIYGWYQTYLQDFLHI